MIYLEAGWWVPLSQRVKYTNYNLPITYTVFLIFCLLLLLFVDAFIFVDGSGGGDGICERHTTSWKRDREKERVFCIWSQYCSSSWPYTHCTALADFDFGWFPSSVSTFCAVVTNMKQQRWLHTLNISIHVLLTWICCNFYVCFLMQEGHEVLLDALGFVWNVLNNQANQVP